MAAPDDLKRFYEAELVPALGPLNARRWTIIWFVLAGFGAAVGFVALVVTKSYVLGSYAAPILFLTALASAVVAGIKWWKLRRDFKHQALARLMKFIDPELRYLPADKIDQETFVAGQIFKERIDTYDGEDCVWGTLGSTKFEFCELDVGHSPKDSDKLETIFKGLYFVADFNKHFRSYTVVLPDAMGGVGFLGQALQALNPARDDLVRLEDPEFEREFVVYSRDQVEARYILTPAMMQRMVALKHKINGRVSFAFTGSAVHVALATTEDRFEPDLFKSLLSFDQVSHHLEDLRMIIGIVEDLDLNTRIWTKA